MLRPLVLPLANVPEKSRRSNLLERTSRKPVLDLDGNGGGSTANLTNELLFTKNLFYGVLGPRANREARGTHTHEDPFWIFGLPTYSTYEVGTIVPYRGS